MRRFKKTVSELDEALREYLPPSGEFFVNSETDSGERSHYFKLQIVETARALGYWANTASFRAWTRLVLQTDERAEILVSFHGIGHEYRGLIAASACFFRRTGTDEGEREVAGVTPLSGDILQLNYLESCEDAEKRFGPWLEDILVVGLETWRQSL